MTLQVVVRTAHGRRHARSFWAFYRSQQQDTSRWDEIASQDGCRQSYNTRLNWSCETRWRHARLSPMLMFWHVLWRTWCIASWAEGRSTLIPSIISAHCAVAAAEREYCYLTIFTELSVLLMLQRWAQQTVNPSSPRTNFKSLPQSNSAVEACILYCESRLRCLPDLSRAPT